MQHIFVRYKDPADHEIRYVSIVDDDTFPSRRVSLTPPLLNKRAHYSIIGCSHGLFCFYCPYQVGRDGPLSGTGHSVLWNPSIRKTVDVVVPNVADADGDIYETVLGFGVCRETNDPKIVKITHIDTRGGMESASCIPWQVEVFTLSTRAWRTLGGNLPCKLICFDFRPHVSGCSVVIDGVLYWFAIDMISMDGGGRRLIVSFDMTSEEFGEINLPNRLAYPPSGHWFSLCKLRESLVVFEKFMETYRTMYDVWMVEDGVSKSFTKLFTFNLDTLDYSCPLGFRKSGEHIIEIVEADGAHLVVYEPRSKHIGYVGIDGEFCRSFVHPYTETLFLLDQPNLTVHNELETQVKGTEDQTIRSISDVS